MSGSEARPGGTVVAVDPGTGKCGLAAVSRSEGVLERDIVDASSAGRLAALMAARHGADLIVIGASTGSGAIFEQLRQTTGLPVVEVCEHMTTLQARQRYWRENPPRGLWRLVPTGLRVPPEPIDDWAAVVIAERYLAAPAT